MKKPQFDIFISYRKKVSGDKPEMLQLLLEESGFRGRVSFDKDNLDGRFDTELLKRIDRCRDFLMFIAPGTFSRIDPDNEAETERYRHICSLGEEEFQRYIDNLGPDADIDFVRIELGRALWRARRGDDIKIIPIAPEDTAEFDFSRLKLPADLADVKNYHAVFYSNSRVARFKDIRRDLLGRLSSRRDRRLAPVWAAVALGAIIVSTSIGLIWFKERSAFRSADNLASLRDFAENPGLLGIYSGDAASLTARYDSLMSATMELWPELPFNFSDSITLAQLRAVNSIVDDMVQVKGGSFTMGASDSGPYVDLRFETPASETSVGDFYIGKHEVTRGQWGAIMGLDVPADSASFPVANISYDDCLVFVERLADLSGLQFEIPTEAQWEYAARGGAAPDRTTFSGNEDPSAVAWYEQTSGGALHPIDDPRDGHYCNGAELYDMSGNLAEWTSTPFHLYSRPEPENPDAMAIRGGSYLSPACEITVTARDSALRSERLNTLGLRLTLRQ